MVAADPTRHYTPRDLAETLVATVQGSDPLTVLDLAAGNGSLLAAASRRWPKVRLIGVDVDGAALAALQRTLSGALCLHQDAMDPLGQLPEIDVVLLNPPFSHRGGTFWSVQDGDGVHRCSPAMAFLHRAVELVREDGEVVAIMPRNSVRSEKDAAVWKALRQRYDVRLCGHFGRNTFDGCFPSVVLVYVRKRHSQGEEPASNATPVAIGSAFLYRGTLPVSNSRGKGETDLLHTIHLAKGRCTSLRCEPSPADLSGLVILLPRVGACHPEHLAIRRLARATRLSECVFAIWSEDEAATRRLYKTLRDNFERLEAAYHGTCARYITVSELVSLLETFGWRAQVVRPGRAGEKGSATFTSQAGEQATSA